MAAAGREKAVADAMATAQLPPGPPPEPKGADVRLQLGKALTKQKEESQSMRDELEATARAALAAQAEETRRLREQYEEQQRVLMQRLEVLEEKAKEKSMAAPAAAAPDEASSSNVLMGMVERLAKKRLNV